MADNDIYDNKSKYEKENTSEDEKFLLKLFQHLKINRKELIEEIKIEARKLKIT